MTASARTPQTFLAKTFLTVWLGQTLSLVGSGLTAFALGVWVFERTGSPTAFALIWVCAELPGLLISPLAGALVDRLDRRRILIAADLMAGGATAAVALLASTGQLQVWQIYVAVSVISLGNAFQTPAYLSSVPLLVPAASLGRANGLIQTAQALRQVISPAAAGVLLLAIGLGGVVSIDLVTLAVGIATLTLVRFPRPAPSSESHSSFFAELAFGTAYIFRHPGLAAVLAVIGLFLFILSIVGVLITPMILAFTTVGMLGLLTSIGGAGMFLGGLTMSAWGGPRRRIDGVLLFLIAGGFLLLLHGSRPSSLLIGILAFGFFFTLPFVFACNDILWQTKVPPAVQGKVFAAREMLTRAMVPLGYALAGPLADRVFEPLLARGGPLAGTVGRVIGVGPGRGIALLFIVGGFLVMVIAASGYLYPRLRNVEREIQDFSAEPAG